ncbi:MAG: hypothetical protein ABIG92_02820 [Candidatus Omnitrophota bacterium]
MGHRIVIVKKRFLFFIGLLIAAFLWVHFFLQRDYFVISEDTSLRYEPRESADNLEDGPGHIMDKEVSLDINFLKGGYFSSRIALERLNLKNIEISGDVFAKGKFLTDKKDNNIGYTAKLYSKNITLNSVPFRSIAMSFTVLDDVLEIEDLRLGKSYQLKGTAGLMYPHEINVEFTIDRADIRDAAILARLKDPNIAMGIIRGIFNIKGPLANLSTSGIIESRNGKIGPIEYNLITLRLEGLGPIISIVDSTIKQKDRGLLVMEGYVDMRSFSRGNLFDSIRIKSDMMTIVWDGWDITKQSQNELSMTKDINENMKVGFKTSASDGLTTYQDRERPEEMSLEYKIGKENLKMKLKEDEEFFVVEHNIRF